jgi:hypothetical protein
MQRLFSLKLYEKIIKDKRIRAEAFASCFKLLYQHSPEETQRNQEQLYVAYGTQDRSATYRLNQRDWLQKFEKKKN